MTKLTTIDQAIATHVGNGDIVALQNMATQAAPMAAVRELIRQGKKDLGLVVLVGGMAVDWLAAAGVICEVRSERQCRRICRSAESGGCDLFRPGRSRSPRFPRPCPSG